MDKYKVLLIQKIKKQISEWFDTNQASFIPNRDVYRFLHSIKGTAGTLELGGLMQISAVLMDKTESRHEPVWSQIELRDFLYELIGLAYQYEHYHEEVLPPRPSRDIKVPLIQIIDDDVSMLILLKDAMEEKGWMVLANTEPEQAAQQYFDMLPDCLIIDIHLPNKDGFQLLEEIQKHNLRQFVPTVMISQQSDRETRLRAYRLGADDFISKPIDMEEFLIRIEQYIKRKKIFDGSVLVDELTQVYNRRFLQDTIRKCIMDFKRTNLAFTVAMLDLDYFKKVNDTYGHLMGDQVLIRFSRFLQEHLRASDIVFRYGGEEFIVLFPKTTKEEAVLVLNRLLHFFNQILFESKQDTFSVSFSGGVHMIEQPSETLTSILHAADEALYRAKANGRSRVEIADMKQVRINKKSLFISIIDDDAIIRMMLTKMMEALQFDRVTLNIQSFEDGSKFFQADRQKIAGEHFLILDGVMPVMDGLEVLQRIKKLENKNAFHILMLTGRKSEDDIAQALKAGADDYATKPFNLDELEKRIKRLIERII